jgi:hypothetical protein
VRGTPILIIFFLMFTVTSLLAPFPMFPGNFLCLEIGPVISAYAPYFSAAFNGLFYGVLIWLVFAGISRKLERED